MLMLLLTLNTIIQRIPYILKFYMLYVAERFVQYWPDEVGPVAQSV